MSKNNISDSRIMEISQKVLQAAQNILGDKLEKVILYGSYARGDYDNESDIDFFILADVAQEESGVWRNKIRKIIPYIDLDYDICVSIHVTGSSIFYEYAEILPFFMNVIKEGVLISG